MSIQTDRSIGFSAWRSATGLLLIGLAGVFGHGALAAMLSGWLPVAPSEVVLNFVAFLQLQALALTVVKYGSDQLIFAIVSGDPHRPVNLRELLVRRFLPMAVIVGVFSCVVMPVPLAALLVSSVVIDAVALSRGAQHTALHDYRRVAWGAFANNPLFVLLAVLSGPHHSLAGLCSLYLLTSLTRLLVVLPAPIADTARSDEVRSLPHAMLGQQLLNIFLHRTDALVVSGAILAGVLTPSPDTRYILYCGKLLEIAGSLLSLLGIVLYPRCSWSGRGRFSSHCLEQLPLLGVASIALVGVVVVGQLLWTESDVGAWWSVVSLTSALLVPVNLLSYSLLRRERINSLMKGLLFSVGIGVLVATLLVSSGRTVLLVVPIQCMIFLFLSGASGRERVT